MVSEAVRVLEVAGSTSVAPSAITCMTTRWYSLGGAAQHSLLTLLPEVLHVAADVVPDAMALLRQMNREASHRVPPATDKAQLTGPLQYLHLIRPAEPRQ